MLDVGRWMFEPLQFLLRSKPQIQRPIQRAIAIDTQARHPLPQRFVQPIRFP
jgi:hypothetical protein